LILFLAKRAEATGTNTAGKLCKSQVDCLQPQIQYGVSLLHPFPCIYSIWHRGRFWKKREYFRFINLYFQMTFVCQV